MHQLIVDRVEQPIADACFINCSIKKSDQLLTLPIRVSVDLVHKRVFGIAVESQNERWSCFYFSLLLKTTIISSRTSVPTRHSCREYHSISYILGYCHPIHNFIHQDEGVICVHDDSSSSTIVNECCFNSLAFGRPSETFST